MEITFYHFAHCCAAFPLHQSSGLFNHGCIIIKGKKGKKGFIIIITKSKKGFVIITIINWISSSNCMYLLLLYLLHSKVYIQKKLKINKFEIKQGLYQIITLQHNSKYLSNAELFALSTVNKEISQLAITIISHSFFFEYLFYFI